MILVLLDNLLEILILTLKFHKVNGFEMYYMSGPFLLIESTDSMIISIYLGFLP